MEAEGNEMHKMNGSCHSPQTRGPEAAGQLFPLAIPSGMAAQG